MFGVQRIGRYEVLNHLASGGMGQVYLARSTGLGGFERQVVVKTLDLSVTDDNAAFVTMFLDEARLVGALNHQYIAPVYEVGCDEEGNYYLVMDYVHGETAEAVFRVSGERSLRLPLGFSLTVVTAVASALDYAHGLCAADGTPLDIVHRDVSLSNIMCGHDGAVKLIDFGIAKAANRATKTQTGTLKGKIGYLAPEQIHRRNVDHRADIFALGIVLYEMTTGVRAFREASDLVTLEKITNGEVRRPSEVVADYPAELERIVMKALETDPDKRYQSASGMARSLEKLAAKMQLPLGHGAIIEVMGRLFSDHKGRRRIARGSNEVKTDSAETALPASAAPPVTDPIDDLNPPTLDERVVARLQGVAARAQRPTIPELSRAQRPTMPIKEGARSQRRTIPSEVPIEDRPTPIAQPAMRGGIVVGEASIADSAAATITTTSSSEVLAGLAPDPAVGTGPQVPLEAALAEPYLVDDGPTVLSPQVPERDDPTDAKTNLVQGEQPAQAYYVVQKGSGTSVVERLRHLEVEATPRAWVVMAFLFVVAVIVASIIALV